MRIEYRIVTDKYNGFEVQFRRLRCLDWLGWTRWVQAGSSGGEGCNSHPTIDTAKDFAKRHAVGLLPPPNLKQYGEVVAQFRLSI